MCSAQVCCPFFFSSALPFFLLSPDSHNHQTNTKVHIGKLLSACVDAALRAGQIIRDVKDSGNLHIREKSESLVSLQSGPGKYIDPCTEADLRAQRLIEHGLRNIWPGIPIVGEESPEQLKNLVVPTLDEELLSIPLQQDLIAETEQIDIVSPLNSICVYIDPLDSTSDFTKGFMDSVMTLIGISVNAEPIAGVMLRPFINPQPIFTHPNRDLVITAAASKSLYYGGKGLSLRGVDPISVAEVRDSRRKSAMNQQLLTVATTVRTVKGIDRALDQLVAAGLIDRERVIRVQGAGYKTWLLMEGFADIYISPSSSTSLWDTCAPDSCLRSLGGCFSTFLASPIQYPPPHHLINEKNVDGIIGTGPDVDHNEIVRLLAQN